MPNYETFCYLIVTRLGLITKHKLSEKNSHESINHKITCCTQQKNLTLQSLDYLSMSSPSVNSRSMRSV